MKKLFILVFCLFSFPILQNAQDVWSLENCIKEAQNKSISVLQSQLNIRTAEISLKQDKMSRYPNLSAGGSANINSGRFIDPTSNSFQTTTSFSNSLSLSSGVQLYTGGRVSNSIKKDKLDIQAAELNAQQASQDIALQVSQTYLNVLLAEEQLSAAKQRLEQSNEQLEQTLKLINAGTLPRNNRLDMDAQIAREQQTVIAAQNAVDLSLLSLKQIMFMDLNEEIRVEKPGDVNVPDTNLDAMMSKELYNTSYNAQPKMRAGEIELNSSQISEKIAQATKRPTVTLSAGVSTNYSNRAKLYEQSTDPVTNQIPLNGEVGGVAFSGTIDNVSFPILESNYPYFNQISDNLGEFIGLSVSIPIWDNKMTKSNMERAALQTESIRLRNEITKQNLRVEIQNALASAKAAQKTYESAQSTVASLKTAFENTQKRFDLGSANSFELTTAQNNLSIAETEVIRSKYDYIFRLKILDFYQGKEIKL